MPDDDPLKEVLSMLSEEQIRALRTALKVDAGGATRRSKMLTKEQLEAVRKEAANYRKAQRQAVEALGVLWNARLDLAINAGHIDSIEDALVRPVPDVAFYDNCNCGGGGGGTGYW